MPVAENEKIEKSNWIYVRNGNFVSVLAIKYFSSNAKISRDGDI